MSVISGRQGVLVLLAMLAAPASGSLSAQEQALPRADINVYGTPEPEAAAMIAGPEIKGIITARSGDRLPGGKSVT